MEENNRDNNNNKDNKRKPGGGSNVTLMIIIIAVILTLAFVMQYNRFKAAGEEEVSYDEFIQMLDDEVFTCTENMKAAAETIVQMADTPNDIAFINAVKVHRAAQAKKNYLEDMATRVQAARSIYNS